MNLKNKLLKKILISAFRKGILKGTLRITTPQNETIVFQGHLPGDDVTWKLYSWLAFQNTILKGDIGLGESYTDAGSPHEK